MKSIFVPTVLALSFLPACSRTSDTGAEAATVTTSTMPVASTTPSTPATPSTPTDGKTATATGTVTAIDATAGKITLSHGPVEALGWPAMTMAFKATPAQIAATKVGSTVRFSFQTQGMDATLIQLAPSP